MITQAICTSFKEEILVGIHNSAHTYKLALFTAEASIGPDTKAYDAAGETVGEGYEPGGAALAGYAHGTNGASAWLTWRDQVWPNATIKARGALIYNASLPGKNAVAVLDLLDDKVSSDGDFKVSIPNPLITFT